MGASTWPPYPPTLGAARETRAARQLRWGPRHGPHTPQCSERPGEPVPLANLDGGPDMAPIPPMLGAARGTRAAPPPRWGPRRGPPTPPRPRAPGGPLAPRA